MSRRAAIVLGLVIFVAGYHLAVAAGLVRHGCPFLRLIGQRP